VLSFVRAALLSCLVITIAVLCTGCPPDIRTTVARGQHVDAVRFQIEGGNSGAFNHFVVEDVMVEPAVPVWESISGGGAKPGSEVAYGTTSSGFRDRVPAVPLQRSHLYCAYAEPHAKACFMVGTDGIVYPVPR
jgi:hypothetical protein